MRGRWRAYLALALHVCFFALPACLVLGLAGIAVLLTRYSIGAGARAGIAALTVAGLWGVGLRAILRARAQPTGVAVWKSAQPRLWKLANVAASAAGTDAPDEIRVISSPTARVREDTGLLGLRSRARYLEIGLPLIAGLTVSELHAVVAHEMGRLGHGAPGVVRRSALSVEHALAELVTGPTKWLFAGYARLLAAATRSTRREVELRAPESAGELTGKKVAVAALHKATVVELAWEDYAEQYLVMATTVEHAPEVVPGFRSFLEHPARKPELADRAKRTIAEDVGDPSIRQRVDVLKRLADRERKRDDRCAVVLLKDPRTSVPELEDQLLVDGLGPRLPWHELARKAGAVRVERQAAVLSSAVARSGVSEDPAIGAVLASIHRGEAADLINPVLNPGLDRDKLDEAVEDTLTELLGDTVVDALVATGRAHHELDWGGPSTVRLSNGRPLDPDRLVRPAVSDPRLIPGLHRTLVDLGVPLQHSRPAAEEPEPQLAGIISSVLHAGRRYDLLVTDRGLLLLPNPSSAVQRLLIGVSARLRSTENARLAELASSPVGPLLPSEDSTSGADWVDSRDIASASIQPQGFQWLLRIELYFDDYAVSSLDPAAVTRDADDVATIELRSTKESIERGEPYDGLGELMGARMASDDHAEPSDRAMASTH